MKLALIENSVRAFLLIVKPNYGNLPTRNIETGQGQND
jgi:hypothetical protein